jgi:hypothetical protein
LPKPYPAGKAFYPFLWGLSFPRTSLAAPKNLAGPVVCRKLPIPSLDSTGTSAIASASRFTFVLAIVLHRAVAKVNEALFAVRTSFDHFLFTRPCAFAGYVARHIRFTEWHLISSKSCCYGHDSTRDPSPANYWGDCSSGSRPCGRCPCHRPFGLCPRPLLSFEQSFYSPSPVSLFANCGTGGTLWRSLFPKACAYCNGGRSLSRPSGKK